MYGPGTEPGREAEEPRAYAASLSPSKEVCSRATSPAPTSRAPPRVAQALSSAEQLAAVDDLAALLAKCEGFPLYISASVRADAFTDAALLLWGVLATLSS